MAVWFTLKQLGIRPKYSFFLASTTFFIIIFTLYKYSIDTEKKKPEDIQITLVKSLDIFKRESKFCEDLTEDWSRFPFSSSFNKLHPILDEEQFKVRTPDGEGFSSQLLPEKVILHHMASQSSVKTVCETGFNYGHSSFNFLSANPDLKVYSFDLGTHSYVKKMNQTIHELFPDHRHHLTLGDSTKTVPEAIQKGVLPLCDIVFVDGGHVYDVARADIINFSNHVSHNNVIVFDDYPTSWGGSFGKAWDEALVGNTLKQDEVIDHEKIKKEILSREVPVLSNTLNALARRFAIKEVLRCGMRKYEGAQRGMVVGTVIKLDE